MFRNPIYTVLGLGLLAADFLEPKGEPLRVEPQPERRGELLRKRLKVLPWAILRLMKVAETAVLSLWTGSIVALGALWVSSVSNLYAHDSEVRCGAMAMAYFAARALRLVILLMWAIWVKSAVLRICGRLVLIDLAGRQRWFLQLLAAVGFFWFWLWQCGAPVFQVITLARNIIEDSPERFPQLDNKTVCRDYLTGPLVQLEKGLDWLLSGSFLGNW